MAVQQPNDLRKLSSSTIELSNTRPRNLNKYWVCIGLQERTKHNVIDIAGSSWEFILPPSGRI